MQAKEPSQWVQMLIGTLPIGSDETPEATRQKAVVLLHQLSVVFVSDANTEWSDQKKDSYLADWGENPTERRASSEEVVNTLFSAEEAVTPDEARRRLGLILRLIEFVPSLKKLKMWLTEPHPKFENVTPADWIKQKQGPVDQLIAALTGQVAPDSYSEEDKTYKEGAAKPYFDVLFAGIGVIPPATALCRARMTLELSRAIPPRLLYFALTQKENGRSILNVMEEGPGLSAEEEQRVETPFREILDRVFSPDESITWEQARQRTVYLFELMSYWATPDDFTKWMTSHDLYGSGMTPVQMMKANNYRALGIVIAGQRGDISS